MNPLSHQVPGDSMEITQSSLAKLETEFKGYIEGERLDTFFKEFGIKFAAGHWCAGDFLDRFATTGYLPECDASEMAQIDRVAEAGILGIEFHENVFIDEDLRMVEDRIECVKGHLKERGVIPTNMNTNLFTDPRWKLGGVTNPDPAIREKALEIAVQGVEIASKLGCSSVALWPGSDGWDYNFQANYGKILDRFVDACEIISMEALNKGLKFGIEAKLKEPREGNMVVATTAKAALVAKAVNEAIGNSNMGCAIDYGHVQMVGVEPADQLYTLKRFGVPIINFHVNTAKTRMNDEDRVFGTGDVWGMTDFCYAAIDTGYEGWFGEDQFTYRMEPVKAMSLAREMFGNVMKKALTIYSRKEELEAAQDTGDAGNTIDVVKRIILGE